MLPAGQRAEIHGCQPGGSHGGVAEKQRVDESNSKLAITGIEYRREDTLHDRDDETSVDNELCEFCGALV